jgi:acetolactate synthase-1/2/3 large subunit
VGIAHAYLDRSPVLLITAQTDPKLISKHTHQVLDLQAVFRPVTKFTASLAPESASEANAANETIDHALAVMRSGRPGPVHLSIPAVYATREAVDDNAARGLSAGISIKENDFVRATEILAKSHRPVIIVGLGLEPDRPYPQLRGLAEHLHAPAIDLPKAKGALPSDHPLFVGTLGLTMTDPAYEILDSSDCILAIGFDPVELVKPWSQPQPLIWISHWENDDPRIQASCELTGNIKGILDALLDATPEVDKDWGETRVSAWREAHHAQPDPSTSLDDHSLRSGRRPAPNRTSTGSVHRIFPADVLDSLRANTPPETIVTTDVGSHKIFTCLHWKALKPNTFFVSNGLSSMGFGLTSAIAAARLTREPTLCITGDAGLAMMMGELALLIEHDLPVIVVVMNDSALDLIRFAQKRKNLQVFGTEFANPDYEKIAAGYALSFARITNRNECDHAVKSAVASRKPTLLEVMVDPAGYR